MKVKELIRLLQQQDPELEAVVFDPELRQDGEVIGTAVRERKGWTNRTDTVLELDVDF